MYSFGCYKQGMFISAKEKLNIFSQVIEKCTELNYKLLYLVISGSHAVNNATQDSDVDARFVFAADDKYYFGFGGKDFIDVGNNDISGMDLVKFVKLALNGNPSVLEILHSDEENVIYLADEFKPLLEIKDKFLAKTVLPHYVNYAKNQLRKAKSCTRAIVEQLEWYENILIQNEIPLDGKSIKQVVRDKPIYQNGKELLHISFPDGNSVQSTIGWFLDDFLKFKQEKFPYSDLGKKRRDYLKRHNFDSKNVSHAIRLVQICLEIFADKTLTVKRPNAQYLLEIKEGKFSIEELEQEFAKTVAEIDSIKESSTLPDEPARELIEKVTIQILRNILYAS